MFEKTQHGILLKEQYINALKTNNIDKVKEILGREDASPELIDNDFIHVAPILWAAQEKNWDMVLTLLELNADLNVKVDHLSWYLMHECLVNAPDKVFNNVLAYAEYDIKTMDGKTVLMVAIEKDLTERANAIIDADKGVLYEKDNNGKTALHYVALKNDQDMFLKLITKGANVFELDKNKKNPIDLLTDELFRNSIPSLLEGLQIEVIKPVMDKISLDKKGDTIAQKESSKEESLSQSKSSIEQVNRISSLTKLTKKK